MRESGRAGPKRVALCHVTKRSSNSAGTCRDAALVPQAFSSPPPLLSSLTPSSSISPKMVSQQHVRYYRPCWPFRQLTIIRSHGTTSEDTVYFCWIPPIDKYASLSAQSFSSNGPHDAYIHISWSDCLDSCRCCASDKSQSCVVLELEYDQVCFRQLFMLILNDNPSLICYPFFRRVSGIAIHKRGTTSRPVSIPLIQEMCVHMVVQFPRIQY